MDDRRVEVSLGGLAAVAIFVIATVVLARITGWDYGVAFIVAASIAVLVSMAAMIGIKINRD